MPAAAALAPLKHTALLKSAASRPVVIDIAWSRPTIDQIKATGAIGVIRYFSNDPTKNLTASEVQQYVAAGLFVADVWETTTGEALQGYRAGVARAQAAAAQRAADGLPTGQPVYFAVDTDTDWPSVEPYFAGAASVLSQPLIGPYGGFRVIEGAYAAGYRLLWQTLAWSGGQVSAHASLYQDGRTALSGAADINQVLAADWGQYPRPEVDMPLTDADAELVANHLLNKTIPNQFRPDSKGQPSQTAVSAFLTFGDHHFDVLTAQLSTLAASESAVKAELDTLKTTAAAVQAALQQILAAGNVTEAEVQAAMTAEIQKLGAALGGVK